MKNKVKISSLVFILSIILLLFRFETEFNILSLFISYILLLLSDFRITINLTSLKLLDYFLSAVLLLALPILSIVLRKKFNAVSVHLNFTNISVAVIIFVILFAPIITNKNPNFQKNLSVTKLLPPLSKVEYLRFSNNTVDSNDVINFVQKKNRIVKQEFDESLIFFSKISIDSLIYVHQNNTVKTFEPSQFENKNNSPIVYSKIYLFGTDEFGRDIFTRLIYGTRVSILIGLGAVFISIVLGFSFGALAGLLGGFIDRALSRITDMFLAFPMIFLVVLIIGLFGNSIFSIIIVLGFSGWMSLFKITKTELVSLKNKDYFLSAQMIGLKKPQLLINEILPVISAPIIVNIIFQFGNVILAEAALSYLSLGIGNEFPSWGSMIQSGQSYITTAWWMIFFPSLFLVAALLTAKNLGDNLNVFLNPKLKND
ncbi:MAG: ABC transporter permease [Ignavibacteriae bacterium]|nr:ABC transporter permease [Ignavibacteriota bacterium]NOG96756.1 ABC transporter permease [Ignavibacteriota bacterium]